jgi:hypothetical protein
MRKIESLCASVVRFLSSGATPLYIAAYLIPPVSVFLTGQHTDLKLWHFISNCHQTKYPTLSPRIIIIIIIIIIIVIFS